MDVLRRKLNFFAKILEDLSKEIEEVNAKAEAKRLENLENTIADARSLVPAEFISQFDEVSKNLGQLSDKPELECSICGECAGRFLICAACPKERRFLFCKSCNPLYSLPCTAKSGTKDLHMCQACLIEKGEPFYCTKFCCLHCSAEHPLYAALRVKLEREFPQVARSRNGTSWNIVWAYFNNIEVQIPMAEHDKLAKVVLPALPQQ